PETRDEILIAQNRVMEEDWEETLKKVGQSSIEEREKNALFGAMILKARLLDEKQVVAALKIQAKEFEAYHKRAELEKMPGFSSSNDSKERENRIRPRWIGDILVQDFGLSEHDRKRIVKKQMEYKIERLNIKLGLNLSDAHIELFNEMDKYLELSYSKDNIEAYIKVLNPLPKSMTKDNIIIWLYHKKIRYGRTSNVLDRLIANKVRPGKKIMLAKGDEPVLAQIKYRFHFDVQAIFKHAKISATNGRTARSNTQTDTNNTNLNAVNGQTDIAHNMIIANSGNIFQFIVSKGTKLVSFRKIKGKSGLNVNRCFVAPPIITPINITKGNNVTRNEDSFEASCDGIPFFSDDRILSLFSLIHVDGEITPENTPENIPTQFNCDFDIKGSIKSGVALGCRNLKVTNLMGRVNATDEVTVSHDIVNGEILSKGTVRAASMENSLVTSQKSIFIELQRYSTDTDFNRIYNSIITSDDILICSDAKLVSCVVRAKNRVILKKVTVGESCKFIIGDSIETITCKKRAAELNNDIDQLDIKIRELQEKSRYLFEKLEKKDISAIDQEIKSLSRNQKTKEDLDKIAELRVIKRQKEKEYEASIDQYSSTFMRYAQQIKQYQNQKNIFEKDKKELESRITEIYKQEPGVPELDIRHSMLPAGTVIQFRYNQQRLSADCEGFVFREEFNHQTSRYELKQHRW
ncbi:MAG: hypothetical protein HQK61_06125, partial [Desulfamplus sp.]|nr:hypothetical protein [Desulfamplus sp.]